MLRKGFNNLFAASKRVMYAATARGTAAGITGLLGRLTYRTVWLIMLIVFWTIHILTIGGRLLPKSWDED